MENNPETSPTNLQSSNNSPETQGKTSSTQQEPEIKKQPELELPEGVSEYDLKPGSDMLRGEEDKGYDIHVNALTGTTYRTRKPSNIAPPSIVLPAALDKGIYPEKTFVTPEGLIGTVDVEKGKITVRTREGQLVREVPTVSGGAEPPEEQPETNGDEEEFKWDDSAGLFELAKRLNEIEDPVIRRQVWEATVGPRLGAQADARYGPQNRRARFESEVDISSLPKFESLYQEMVSRGNIFEPGHHINNNAKDINALSPKDREAFLNALASINPDYDLNGIINRIVGTSIGRLYPGQDLQEMLRADRQMGLGGELVRKRVEQLMAAEEYDDTKQMRGEALGAIMQSINQYLTEDPALQLELRVSLFARYKLHESTILARYVGVGKLAEQMSNFYQDEFRMIMDTKLFREAAIMLDSDDGAYFREGLGFGPRTQEEAERDRKSQRYEPITLQKALLLTPDIADEDWKEWHFTREQSVEIARKLVERANINGSFASDQATLESIAEELARDKPDLGIDLSRKSELSSLFDKSLLVKSKFSYEQIATIYEAKGSIDQATQKRTPFVTVVNDLIAKGSLQFSNDAQRQKLIDLLNESARGLGLSIKVFDIYGRSAEHTGLVDKHGVYIRPETKLSLPGDFTWENLFKSNYFRLEVAQKVDSIRSKYEALYAGKAFHSLTDEQKKPIYDEVDDYIKSHRYDEAGARELQAILDPVITKWKGRSINLKDVNKIEVGSEEEAILDVIRDLEAQAIRDAQAKGIREYVRDHYTEIDLNETNPYRRGAREYKKAMHNQVLLSGLNKDTKGKPFLRRFASTDIISLVQNSARKSVLDAMRYWDDDFQNMKKHNDALITGERLKTALTDKEPGLFNSTSKLQNPVEHLRAIKDVLVEWTQEHRVEYMDFISEAVLLYLAKYNRENEGYRNAGIVRVMNLAQEMIDGSVLRKKAKEAVEATLYLNKNIAQTLYTLTKADKGKAFFGLLKDIFTASTKGLFQT